MTDIPKHGRDIFVHTRYMSDPRRFAPPERFLVAIDDDVAAMAAIRKHLDFAPHDDRELWINPIPVPRTALENEGMREGEVRAIRQ